MHDFTPLGDDASCDGECRIVLAFGKKQDEGLLAIISGRRLYTAYQAIGDHKLRWLWQLPRQQPAIAEGSPVVHTIEIKEAARQYLNALLYNG